MDLKLKSPTEQIREVSNSPVDEREEPINPVLDSENLMPTGSTILNCSCSDNWEGGYARGTLVNVIGDSSAGKSFLVLTGLAEMAYDPKFDEYDLYYSDAENALAFNMDYLFGPKFLPRVRTDVVSRTIQNLYGNVYSCIEKGKPFVWVEDSLDALTSNEELIRAKKLAKKFSTDDEITKVSPAEREKKEAGSYKTEKAKWASELLRVITYGLKDTKSLVIIVSQTRDNIGFGFEKNTRSGGRALKFYSTHEMWLSIVSKYTKEYKKTKDIVGVDVRTKVSKNKLTGKVKKVDYPIYYDHGIDDVGANINFLTDKTGWWKKEKQTIVIPEFDFKGTAPTVHQFIRKERLQKELAELVGTVWNEKEEALRLGWGPKYE